MGPPTWFVTGAASGFGKSISLAALDAGYKVIGSTRDHVRANKDVPEFAAKGGIWIRLNPAQPDSYERYVELFKEHDIDVIVTNAGYAFIGGVEDTSEEEVRDQMEVNFYGPLRAVRAVLPHMRAKRSGHIVLVSSGAGFIARPGRGVYSASKYAIEAMHESLQHEVANLGIKILIVDPGAFRTPFSTRLVTPAAHESTGGYSEGYKGTTLEMMVSLSRGITSIPDAVKGDPDKAAQFILTAVRDGHDYLRMILGPDCVAAMEEKLASFHHDLEATRAIANATDID